MYTTDRAPGKFEGNDSQWEAEAVYEASMSGCAEELGDVQDFGWYGLVHGRKAAWIITEDSQGFVEVTFFRTWPEAEKEWNSIEGEYDLWAEDVEEEDASDGGEYGPDYPCCPVCRGDGTMLGAGTLGNLTWYRCRQCGMDYNTRSD